MPARRTEKVSGDKGGGSSFFSGSSYTYRSFLGYTLLRCTEVQVAAYWDRHGRTGSEMRRLALPSAYFSFLVVRFLFKIKRKQGRRKDFFALVQALSSGRTGSKPPTKACSATAILVSGV